MERRIDLVYGGGRVGLMGLVSQAVHDGGRHVLGFVPFSSLLSLIRVEQTDLIIFPEHSWFFTKPRGGGCVLLTHVYCPSQFLQRNIMGLDVGNLRLSFCCLELRNVGWNGALLNIYKM